MVFVPLFLDAQKDIGGSQGTNLWIVTFFMCAKQYFRNKHQICQLEYFSIEVKLLHLPL